MNFTCQQYGRFNNFIIFCILYILFIHLYPQSYDEKNYTMLRTTLRSCGDFCHLIKSLNQNISKPIKIKESTVPYIYLTFDDAPIEGTDRVLDALKEVGVRATFFVNGFGLHTLDTWNDWSPIDLSKSPNKSNLLNYRNLLVRIIKEGHILGDHSYDHMKHNHKGIIKENAYAGGLRSILWFGEKNINAVIMAMRDIGFQKETIINVTNTMWNYVRLPYTNNWRIGPIISGVGGPNSDRLSDGLRDDGALVFGWDLDWNIDWTAGNNGTYISRFLYGGQKNFEYLNNVNQNSETKIKGKTVILSHDLAHRTGLVPDGKKELIKFLTLAKQNGYKFRTVDTYLTD